MAEIISHNSNGPRPLPEPTTELVRNFYETPALTEEKGCQIGVPSEVGKAAFYYEKIRNAVDYQDEHLLLKNAIARIMRRKLTKKIESDKITEELVCELAWARYIKNDSLSQTKLTKISYLITKYKTIYKTTRSLKYHRSQIYDFLIGPISCEIEETIVSHQKEEALVDFAKKVIIKQVQIPSDNVDPRIQDIQLEIAIRRCLLKADTDRIEYRLLQCYFPKWSETHTIPEIGKNYDWLYDNIQSQLSHPLAEKVNKYIKKNGPPFQVIWGMIKDLKNAKEATELLQDERRVIDRIEGIARNNYTEAKRKVLRGVVRGIAFILLTKLVLALILELPYDLFFVGHINYLALGMNILIPPFLMLIAGIFIKVPGKENTMRLDNATRSVIYSGTLGSPPFSITRKKHSKLYFIFDTILGLVSIAILSSLVWLLVSIHFNIVSMLLFFFFLSIVSFLSVRIRGIARELEMKQPEENFWEISIGLLFLPFVRIGHWLSSRFSKYNVLIFILDFMIEAPLKTLIAVAESWIAFVREKREDLE